MLRWAESSNYTAAAACPPGGRYRTSRRSSPPERTCTGRRIHCPGSSHWHQKIFTPSKHAMARHDRVSASKARTLTEAAFSVRAHTCVDDAPVGTSEPVNDVGHLLGALPPRRCQPSKRANLLAAARPLHARRPSQASIPRPAPAPRSM